MELETQVDDIFTADKAITKMIQMSFPEYIGTVRYSLKEENGSAMKGTNTFRNVDAVGGCKMQTVQTELEE